MADHHYDDLQLPKTTSESKHNNGGHAGLPGIMRKLLVSVNVLVIIVLLIQVFLIYQAVQANTRASICNCASNNNSPMATQSTMMEEPVPRDCEDHRRSGIVKSGWYSITIAEKQVAVFCDMDTEGGGWTMLLRRRDGSVEFKQTWEAYKIGFGDGSEFWIGNDNIHDLTMNNGRQYQLRIDMTSNINGSRFATYNTFEVADENSKYMLTVGGYLGDAGDCLSQHSGFNFSTFDQDNDASSSHCALTYTGGWWYKSCFCGRLTGRYGQGLDYAQGIDWSKFLGHNNFLDYADMKIRAINQ